MSARVNVIFHGESKSAVKASHDVRDAVNHAGRSARTASAEFHNSERTLQRSARGALAASGAFRGLGRAIAFSSAAFLGTAGFVAVVKASIGAASNLHEQINKSQVVFKAGAKEVLAWSKTTANSLGIARHEALAFAATFGNILVPMGFARKEAGHMSVRLVKLAADMASFNNASPEDVLRALQSGLAGQVRPLRQFGVFLSEDRIKAEAFGSGIVKATKNVQGIRDAELKLALARHALNVATQEHGAHSVAAAKATLQLHAAELGLHKALAGSQGHLTAAQRALAVYRITMKDTSDAHGDFARTSGGLANQQRILKANLAEVETLIGTALMPTVLGLVKHLNAWAKSVQEGGRNHKAFVKTIHEVIGGLKTFLGILGTGIRLIARVVDAVGGLKVAVVGLLIAMSVSKVAKFTNAMVTGFQAQGRAAVQSSLIQQGAAERTAATYVAGMTTMEAATVGLSATIKAALISTGIGAVVVAVGILVAYVITHWAKVKKMLSEFADWLKDHWKKIVFLALTGPFGAAALLILRYWRQVARFFADLPGRIVGFFKGIGNRIKDAFLGGGNWQEALRMELQRKLFDKLVEDARGAGIAAGSAFGLQYHNAALAWAVKTAGDVTAAMSQSGLSGEQGAGGGGGGGPKPSGTKQQKGLVKTAEELGPGSGGVYLTGGTGPKGYDCSGYLYDIYRRNGIAIPRTSEAQWYDRGVPSGTVSVHVPKGKEQPGDGVYFTGSSKYAPPGHCGIYVGGGKFIEYYSSGKPARYSTLSSRGDYWGARRWLLLSKKNAGGNDPAPTPTPTPTDTFTDTKKKGGAKGLSEASAIGARGAISALLATITPAIQAGLSAAGKIAEQHLKELRDKIHKGISAVDLAKIRLAVKRWSDVLKKEIAKAVKAAKDAADFKQFQIDRSVFRAFEKIQEAFDKETADWHKSFDKVTADHLKSMAKGTELALRAMQKSFSAVMREFDKETQRGLASLAAPALTPAEAELQSRAAAKAAGDLQKALSDALASGDPAAVAQAQYDIETAALEARAKQEREAADAEAQAAQDAYSEQRQLLADALNEQEQDRENAFSDEATKAEQAYQDQRDAEAEAYDKARAIQWQAEQDLFDDFAWWVDRKVKRWQDFLKWFAAHQPAGAAVGQAAESPDWNDTPPPKPPGWHDPGGIQSAQHGGFVRGTYVGKPDTVMIRATPGEYVLTREQVADALGGGGGSPVVINNPTFLGTSEREVARALERLVAPEQGRRVGFRRM